MRPGKMNKLAMDQRGQAATEFIVAAVFLLVPLFIIIPLLGNYIDIKHAAIQQARFEAWEYSVWTGPHEQIKNDVKGSQSPGRLAYADVRKKGLGYFFSDPTADSYGNPNAQFTINPLWSDHKGNSLFTSTEIITGDIRENKTPDGLAGGLDGALDVVSFVVKIFGDVMKFFHVDAKFDAIYTKGYYTSDVKVSVRSIDDILPQYSLSEVKPSSIASPMEITAKASVLTNGWNAGSTENATAESRGLVFSAALKPLTDIFNGVIAGINKLTSLVPFLKVQLPSLPDFGYVKDDLIPYEHLEGNEKELLDESGLFYYE